MKISLAKSKWKKMVQYCNQCPMDIDMFPLYQRKPRQIPCLHLAYHAFSIWLKCDATNGACHAILFAVVLAVLCMPIFAWISNELPTAFAKLHCSSARVWNRHRSVLHLIPHIRKFYNTHTTTRSRISSIFWCIAKWWWQTIWWESANENLTLGWWNIHFRWSV